MVNPDNLALKIAELADLGRVQGIADVRDDTSDRTGQRLVDRAQARRRRAGGAQQPVQAHRAADQLLGQHAGARRRRAAHADHRPVHLLLGDPPDRGHPAADPLPPAQGRGGRAHAARPGQGARRARRGHRADPAQPRRRRGPRRPDGAARDRRAPGPARSSTCSCAGWPPSSGRRSSTGSPSSRSSSPTSRTSWPTPPGSGRSSSTSWPRSCEKYGDDRRTPDHRGRRRPLDGGPDPRRGARRLDHPRRLRQAHPLRPVPLPEARRQGRARRDPARRRRRRALHRDDQPPLAAVLHHGRPGLPHQGLQPARGLSATPRAATSPACCRSSPTRTSRRCWRSATTSRRPYLVLATRNGPGQEDPPRRLQQPAPGRRHRDQLPRGRRRADRRRAGRARRRHPAGLPQGPVDPVPRRRHPAAADGPRDVRRRRA